MACSSGKPLTLYLEKTKGEKLKKPPSKTTKGLIRRNKAHMLRMAMEKKLENKKDIPK